MLRGLIVVFSLLIGARLAACHADRPRAADAANGPRSVSGIYPHLAFFNDENECGTGAVVPWAGRLWVVTYAPHKPRGSSDLLYEITPELERIERPESIGGTPANRMIHRESQQLFIGPYVIDAERRVRVIPYDEMFGRPTGTARHLTDPANKVYFATMEEGFYEVDVDTLAVRELWRDEQLAGGRKAGLPGYHGKGLYSGQGRLVYANNGEHGEAAQRRPDIPSGVLAEWDGRADDWTVVRRNQFTEVTGPGGIHGNADPKNDPLWAVGWDERSLILQVLDDGRWHAFRLPKSSHSYDGAHGWNTEWPRIRDIGEDDLLMTMHGAFWRFPRTLRADQSAGIAPRSNYLKVVGDFCRWGDYVVLGCDDTARSEFLNKRKLKGGVVPAGQSQSNLRFIEPAELDRMGPVIGRGAVWLYDAVKADQPSEPYLFSGYDRRMLFLSHGNVQPVTFRLEVDRRGNGEWTSLKEVVVQPDRGAWVPFAEDEQGAWIRVSSSEDCDEATAFFQYGNIDRRGIEPDAIFDGLAKPGDQDVTGGLLHARGGNFRTLRFVAQDTEGEIGGYDMDGTLTLRKTDDMTGVEWVQEHAAIPEGVISVDAASVLFVDEAGQRWRLPKGNAAFDTVGPLGPERVCREVCTERDLLNVHGTFYELPAVNAGGFARLRPVATHNRRIKDFATYRGLLVMSGVSADAPKDSGRIVHSEDGRCALWVGSVDDLWYFGKPRGTGGPWRNTKIEAGQPSDPYLMTGYDRKRLRLAHESNRPVTFYVEVDVTGTGRWSVYQRLEVPAATSFDYTFPPEFAAYWVRLRSDTATTATAEFTYD